MKTTGMIRQLDSLGRIVLPIELRRVEGNTIILRKYEPNCHFCGGSSGLTSYKDKMICRRCLNEIKSL